MASQRKEFNKMIQSVLDDGKIEPMEKLEIQHWLTGLDPLPDLADRMSLKSALVSSICQALRKKQLDIPADQAVRCVDEVVDILLTSLPEQTFGGQTHDDTVSVHFSGMGKIRDEDMWGKIKPVLESADSSIRIAAFNLTYFPLRKVLQQQAEKGIPSYIFAEDGSLGSDKSGLYDLNQHKNITIKLDSPNTMMHHKFIIVDEKIVINGSMNFTHAGHHRNFENIMIVRNQSVVDQFIEEFEILWTIGSKL